MVELENEFAAGGFAGGMTAGVIDSRIGGGGGPSAVYAAYGFGALVGATLGSPAGAYLGGVAANGTGSLVWTYVGGLLGTASGAGLALLGGPGILIGLAGPVIGSVVGYQKSSAPTGTASLRPWIAPGAGPAPTRVGISGRF